MGALGTSVRVLVRWYREAPERALQRPVIPSQGERWRAMRGSA
jgi:hypothetical protein